MIYIHIPYCRSFCTYCGFYSELAERSCGRFESFVKALCNEVEERCGEFGSEVNTLYFGGGTPSVLPLSDLGQVVSCLEEYGARGFSEFTMEVNPDDIVRKGLDYVHGLVDLGVNRVSMGVQSFDASLLRWMNRRHGPDDAVRAYELLCEGGIRNVSMDLIFGVGNAVAPRLAENQHEGAINDGFAKGTVMDRWRKSVEKMLSLRPSHISAYQLSVEEGSALEALAASGRWNPSSEEESAMEYEYLCEALRNAGYHHYEISNFALPGFEAQHNSAYWRHVPYVGLGPGAHSFRICDGKYIRRWNNPQLAGYIDAMLNKEVSAKHHFGPQLRYSLERNQTDIPAGSQLTDVESDSLGQKCQKEIQHDNKIYGMEILDDEQIALEKIMLSLRTDVGVDQPYLLSHVIIDKFKVLLDRGLLVKTIDQRIRIPEDRFFISDNIISALF